MTRFAATDRAVASAPPMVAVLLASYRRNLATENKAERTIQTYTESLRQFFDFLTSQGMPCEPTQVSRGHVEAFIADLVTRFKPATAHNRSRALRSFYRWAVDEGEIVTVIDVPNYDSEGSAYYLVDLGESRGFIVGEALEVVVVEAAPAEEPQAEPEPVSGATGTHHYPLADYRVTQAFGCSVFASFYPTNESLGCPWHNGLDLGAPLGTAMLASDGVTVKYAGWCDCGPGLYVEIDHLNGTSTIYGHMNAVYVEIGQAVNQGETIGEVGSTGFSTGPHFHFMLKIDGTTVDPVQYLSQ